MTTSRVHAEPLIELPLRDKVSLLSALAMQTCGRRERLLREATRALRGLLHT